MVMVVSLYLYLIIPCPPAGRYQLLYQHRLYLHLVAKGAGAVPRFLNFRGEPQIFGLKPCYDINNSRAQERGLKAPLGTREGEEHLLEEAGSL